MEDGLDANYELVSDIDASDTAQFNDGRGFDPIGGAGFRESTLPPFTGPFDGHNHTVTGLTIDRPDENDIGLFGGAGSGATLRNVTLANVTVTGGERIVGGLVGSNDNNQDDVVDEDEAQSNGTVIRSFATGTLSGENNVGGLVGESTSGEIEDSYWDEQSTGVSVSAGSAIGLTTPQMQGQSAPTNMTELEFENTWTSTDGYPALLMRTIESRDATLQTDSISSSCCISSNRDCDGDRNESTSIPSHNKQ